MTTRIPYSLDLSSVAKTSYEKIGRKKKSSLHPWTTTKYVSRVQSRASWKICVRPTAVEAIVHAEKKGKKMRGVNKSLILINDKLINKKGTVRSAQMWANPTGFTVTSQRIFLDLPWRWKEGFLLGWKWGSESRKLSGRTMYDYGWDMLKLECTVKLHGQVTKWSENRPQSLLVSSEGILSFS